MGLLIDFGEVFGHNRSMYMGSSVDRTARPQLLPLSVCALLNWLSYGSQQLTLEPRKFVPTPPYVQACLLSRRVPGTDGLRPVTATYFVQRGEGRREALLGTGPLTNEPGILKPNINGLGPNHHSAPKSTTFLTLVYLLLSNLNV